ncbi:hypothetical protein V2J09_000493 [Rumex salicifolius]
MIPLSLHPSPPRKEGRLERRRFRGICRAELAQDAPFIVAIGACMLNSLVFAEVGASEEEEEEAVIGTTDARFTVMSIISFIPYFNWLSWVFAWMDSSKRRYAVYAIVYLAPYLSICLNFKEDDFLNGYAFVKVCSFSERICHFLQMRAGYQLPALCSVSSIYKYFSPAARRKETKDRRVRHEMREEDHIHLPSSQERLRDEIRKFGMPRKPFLDRESKNSDVDEDEE